MSEPDFTTLRQRMLAEIAAKTIFSTAYLGKAALDARVMKALAEVPRHEFVPFELRPFAYVDTPLPIGFGKTISQPFIVAVMTDLLDVQPTDRVLEIGTGLGYQSAVLGGGERRVWPVGAVSETVTLSAHGCTLLRTAGETRRHCGWAPATGRGRRRGPPCDHRSRRNA